MVLCKFFQQGTCRYGTKCQNEHFDVKNLLKQDVESALNGKQWPFSCFGPFKDKPCLQNFITDQSFEEMRFLCYDSKQKNCFEQFHQQFTREAMEATNKMKAILQLTPEVVDIVTKIYDNESTVSAGVKKGNNPFVNPNSNNAAGSLFAKPNAALGGNAFGGGANLFGSAGNTGAQQNTIFAQQTPKPTNSIFGGGTPAQNQTNGLFSQPQMGVNAGLFSQASQQIMQPAGATAPQNQTNGLFSQPQMGANAAVGAGLFAQASQQAMQPTGAGFGLFSQAAQQNAPLFTQQQNTGMFMQSSMQQQQQQQQQQAAGNLFAQAVQQQQQNLFAQPTQQSAAGGANIFAQAAQQMQPQPPQAGLFQQNASLNNQQMQQPVAAQNGIYSKMEDLTAEEIEAFKADAFIQGKIPFSPPPREFVN